MMAELTSSLKNWRKEEVAQLKNRARKRSHRWNRRKKFLTGGVEERMFEEHRDQKAELQ